LGGGGGLGQLVRHRPRVHREMAPLAAGLRGCRPTEPAVVAAVVPPRGGGVPAGLAVCPPRRGPAPPAGGAGGRRRRGGGGGGGGRRHGRGGRRLVAGPTRGPLGADRDRGRSTRRLGHAAAGGSLEGLDEAKGRRGQAADLPGDYSGRRRGGGPAGRRHGLRHGVSGRGPIFSGGGRPMHEKPIALEAYGRLADAYGAGMDPKAHNAFYARPAVLSLLPPVEGKRVLDAACGPGVYAEWLADRGAEVVGVDVCPRMVELARLRLKGKASVGQ